MKSAICCGPKTPIMVYLVILMLAVIDVRALKLLTIDRELGKSGLHRVLITNVTFRA